MNLEGPSSSIGTVLNEEMVCQYSNNVASNGFWSGDNPFDYTAPVLMIQFILIFIITRITYYSLRPLRQSLVIAQIIGGVIIGPSFLTANGASSGILFPPGNRLILDTVAAFGFMIHLFVLGVQIDVSLLHNPGREAMVIGLTSFAFPLALGVSACKIIERVTPSVSAKAIGLPMTVPVNSLTYSAVTTSLLTELNILNSELGRLASSTSMVCSAFGWFMLAIVSKIGLSVFYLTVIPLFEIFTALGYLGILFFILRPLVLHIGRRTPEGEPMNESHFLAILFIVLGAAFCGEFFGQHASFGAFVLGLFIPDGPPLGSRLMEKLDTVPSGLLFSIYCTVGGIQTDLYGLEGTSLFQMEFVIAVVYISKFVGTILSSLYFEIPFWDALLLGLLMCCKGTVEVGVYCLWLDLKVVNSNLFTLLIINMVVVTAVATSIVSYFYDPSTRYMGYHGRTILQSKQDFNFRILVCIHCEDNVPPIINLIEASNPTRGSPLSVSVLQLTELTGSASAILAPHHQRNKPTSKMTRSDHIVNAFKYFEQYHRQGSVAVHHFIATAPYASMHMDICTLALDRNISIVILPFHKQWGIDGTVERSFSSIRTVNKNVINATPCSVGVLVNRSQIGGNQPVLTCQSLYRIATLFIGGADDEEALAYSIRMAEHPSISLTVVWFKPWVDQRYRNDKNKNNLNNELIMNDFRAYASSNKKIVYKEETVNDGLGTTQVIRSMEDGFDLFIVGRHHEADSPVTSGFTEWSECPELGTIGDMLASTDFPFSVLVVQQPLGARLLNSSKCSRARSKDKNSLGFHNFSDE